jgi:hypothetical protein
VIYRSKGAKPPGTPRAAHIKCRQRRPSLTGRPHHAETAVCTRVCDHYGAATEGPRCPVTPAPTSSTTLAQCRLKRPARYARLLPRLRSFNGRVPYQVRVTPHTIRAKGSKKLTLFGCYRCPDLKTGRANPHLRESRASPSNGAITDLWS